MSNAKRLDRLEAARTTQSAIPLLCERLGIDPASLTGTRSPADDPTSELRAAEVVGQQLGMSAAEVLNRAAWLEDMREFGKGARS